MNKLLLINFSLLILVCIGFWRATLLVPDEIRFQRCNVTNYFGKEEDYDPYGTFLNLRWIAPFWFGWWMITPWHSTNFNKNLMCLIGSFASIPITVSICLGLQSDIREPNSSPIPYLPFYTSTPDYKEERIGRHSRW